MHDYRPKIQRTFSLAALFILTSACAVILGLVTLLMRDAKRLGTLGEELVGAAVGGAISLSVLGVVLGLLHYARLRGVLWGGGVGFVLGLVFGPMVYIAPQDFPLLVSTSLGGAAIIVGVATVLRLTSHPTSAQPDTADNGSPTATSSGSTRRKRHPLDPDPEDKAR